MTQSLTFYHKIKQASVLLACLFLVACQPGGRLTPIDANSTILAFGDSLTYGTGVSAGSSYPAVLDSLIEAEVIRSGVPGEISSDGLKRLEAVLRETNPDLVLLCHGGNDILRRMSSQDTKQNLTAMVNLILSRDAEVILIAVPNVSLFPKAASYYAELEEELAVPVEYDILASLQRDNSKKSGAVHFDSIGYREMAEAVRDLLAEEGAI